MVFFPQRCLKVTKIFPPIVNGVYVLYCSNHQENPIVTEMGVAHALVLFCEIVRFRVSSSILVKMVASFAPTHSADPVTLYGSDPLHSNLAAS